MNIAIIPARGGSKRIPRKNIKPFFGKPMIEYAITAAKETGLFEHIIISTDDEEIANLATEFGAQVPFIRPPELADDFTPTTPVIQDAINKCFALFGQPRHVCCIYPSVPLINSIDIINAYNLMVDSNATSCFPVVEFNSAPQRAFKRDSSGKVSSFYPEFKMTRTQDLEKSYHDAGQFYWGKTSAWVNNTFSDAVTIVLPKWQVIDIDTDEDWIRAEFYYEALHKN